MDVQQMKTESSRYLKFFTATWIIVLLFITSNEVQGFSLRSKFPQMALESSNNRPKLSARRLFRSLINQSPPNDVPKKSKSSTSKEAKEAYPNNTRHNLLGATSRNAPNGIRSKEENGIFLDLSLFDRQIEDLTTQINPNFRSGFVCIAGNPNVGKSTLLNALIGQKLNIVSPKPQTTRHKIHGILTEKDFQVVFTDTPGMLKPVYKMQETMRDVVHESVRDADMTLLVTDVYGEPLHDEKIMARLNASASPIIVAINKIDLLKQAEAIGGHHQFMVGTEEERSRSRKSSDNHVIQSLEELRLTWNTLLPKAEIFEISAKSSVGIDALRSRLVSFLQPGPKYYPDDDLSDRDERFFTTEIIRETLFEQFQEEIPYSCEVVIDSFKDRSQALSAIEASIIVDRESQKGIVIGKNGSKLKEVGIAARLKLEEFLDRKVFLSLNVKVDEDWRAKEESLKKYGYIQE